MVRGPPLKGSVVAALPSILARVRWLNGRKNGAKKRPQNRVHLCKNAALLQYVGGRKTAPILKPKASQNAVQKSTPECVLLVFGWHFWGQDPGSRIAPAQAWPRGWAAAVSSEERYSVDRD